MWPNAASLLTTMTSNTILWQCWQPGRPAIRGQAPGELPSLRGLLPVPWCSQTAAGAFTGVHEQEGGRWGSFGSSGWIS